jgi:purine nucleosidase
MMIITNPRNASIERILVLKKLLFYAYSTKAMPDFLIDTDTASDDAVALIMALRAPDVRVVAITTVAGNCGVVQATRNALYTVELCGASVPVYAGAAKPLLRAHQNADWFHGRDGMGDHHYPAAHQTAGELHAVDAILAAVEAHPGLVLVTLGPLTNLALALLKNPGVAEKVGRCVVMGGAPCCEGNVTPASEYNIWVDPEAAQIVLRSGLPVELVGWQLCRGEAVLHDDEITRILQLDTKLARFAIECNSRAREAYLEQTGEGGISLPDPVAMSIALDPAVGTKWSEHYVDVETKSELTRGMTVVDKLNVARDERNRETWSRAGRANVCWSIDTVRWKGALYRALGCFALLLWLLTGGISRAQVVAPQVIQKVEPQDDPDLKSYLIDPTRVEVTVDDAGDPVFLRSTVGLPDNVVRALAQWRFRPGTKDGQRVGFVVFADAQVRRPIDRYLRIATNRSGKPGVRPHNGFAPLSPETAADLERSLGDNEASMDGRTQLLRYAVEQNGESIVDLRGRQISWLVRNQPASAILGSSAALIFPSSGPLQDAAGYDLVKNLWIERVSKDPKDAVVLSHAVWFLELPDPETTERILGPVTSTVGGAAAWLGKLYGYQALGVSSLDLKTGAPAAGENLPASGFGAHARSALTDTSDERVVLSALATVAAAGRSLGKTERLPTGYAEFCDSLLSRVKTFYPGTGESCSATGSDSGQPGLSMGGTLMQARLIRQERPVYPPEARKHGIQGTVSFAAMIGKDGSIRDLEFLSGPLALYSNSRAAVLKWEYKPTMLNGAPVEVSTSLEVNFTLSH